jgi:hypothetical protein
VLDEREAERRPQRSLDRRERDLAVALGEVRIADVEPGAGTWTGRYSVEPTSRSLRSRLPPASDGGTELVAASVSRVTPSG